MNPAVNASQGVNLAPRTGLRLGVWFVACSAGLLQAWSNRFFISPDGNNYLDIASAYLRGDWGDAINGWWSPMFSWILGAVLFLFKPAAYWETTVIHLVNFAAFLLSLLSFEFFLRSLLALRRQPAGSATAGTDAFWLLGYSAFLSTSLYLITLRITTPDMWLALATYLASGIVLRIRAGSRTYFTFAFLGAVLGFGYLLKSFFFPLSFIFLFTAWIATGRLRKNALRFALAMAVFFLVSGPFLLALSRAKHRFTFGDTGRFAFIISVDRLVQPYFWHGENHTGTPKHPTRQLMTAPRLYEFAGPIGGSYPVSRDMSYWMEGATFHFDLNGQLAVLRQSAGTFYQIWSEQIALFVGLLVLLFFAGNWRDWLTSLAGLWCLWLPSLLACLAYSLVLTEPRYLGAFVLILWMAAFGALRFIFQESSRRLVLAAVLAVSCATGVRIAKSMVSDSVALRTSPDARQNPHWEMAKGLIAAGISPGDRVAGISIKGDAHWARLAGVQVVAEIPLGEEALFWDAEPSLRRKVMDTFAATDARAVVARAPAGSANTTGWERLGGTDYLLYRLR